ncbi:MerR family transcriptional regulator [Croceicoccus sp. YJ47]|uniref:MerR family transcriptional regulator n=1 Tax=Croceicoccus sp. YJ47 TaxID=2798724 RepID=UPI0019210751|nr:MerR family transcriptional regulator [Croceicoccus sp. YJ47]QQN74609.1 MerR family transcriptional regulator [Croceicoccus sp. YJ47]
MKNSDDLFDDGKDPQAFRTIGEVASALSIKPHVLRYWETQFSALAPIKRSGNRRYYRPEDVAIVQRIDRLLNHEGYTIRGAAKALAEPEPAATTAAAARPAPPRGERPGMMSDEEMLMRLRAIRETLSQIKDETKPADMSV